MMLADGLKELRDLADELFEEAGSPDEEIDEDDKARLREILDDISNMSVEAIRMLSGNS